MCVGSKLSVTCVKIWKIPSSAQLKGSKVHLAVCRGVLTYWTERGCAALMGRFFYKKSLNMGQLFWLSPNPKIAKFLKNGPIFQEKSLKMGTLFCQKSPLKMGRWVGFWGSSGTPLSNSNLSTPPGAVCIQVRLTWISAIELKMLNSSQLARLKKYIPYMSLSWNL